MRSASIDYSYTPDPLTGRFDTERLGSLIRKRRTALGLSQTETARRAGFPASRLCHIEYGGYSFNGPRLATLYRLAAVLELPARVFFDALGVDVDHVPTFPTSGFPTLADSARPSDNHEGPK